MGVLLIICPKIGKEFSTEVQVDSLEEANILPGVGAVPVLSQGACLEAEESPFPRGDPTLRPDRKSELAGAGGLSCAGTPAAAPGPTRHTATQYKTAGSGIKHHTGLLAQNATPWRLSPKQGLARGGG